MPKPAAAPDGSIVIETSPGRALFLVSSPKRKAAGLERLMGRIVQEANSAGLDAIARPLDPAEPPTPATPAGIEPWRETEAARWAEIRQDWLRQHPSLTAAEVAMLAGSTTKNPAALLNGWVEAQRVFGLKQGAKRLYPAFQIGPDGQPRPGFRALLTALEGRLEGWPLAIWLTRPNADLTDWQSPLERLEREPEAVLAAARHALDAASY